MGEVSVLIAPSLGGSGPGHWQSIWQRRNPGYRRVVQRDWEDPDLEEWVTSLEDAVHEAEAPVVFVAHSLSCSLVAHWARRPASSRDKVAAAMLVSPADVESDSRIPPEARRFEPMPLDPLPFQTTVVASSDDPYVAPERARHFASCWGQFSSRWARRGTSTWIQATASGLKENASSRNCWGTRRRRRQGRTDAAFS